MGPKREFFSEVKLNNLSLTAYLKGEAVLRDRYLLKDFLDYVHMKRGLLAPYSRSYPLVEARELLPSFEKNFAEYRSLPSFSLVAFNRALSYQDEIFQFDLLHPPVEGKKKGIRENLEKIAPHIDREIRPNFRSRYVHRDLTDLSLYEEILEFLLHMDRAQVIAKDRGGVFRLLGVYASFPSDLDTEIKTLGHQLGKFKMLDHGAYERERDFVYQFLMELYGFPIAAERRTSAALFARKLSRLKEQYLIKVLGASDRTITSMTGFEQKRYPLVEKVALVSLPAALTESYPHLCDQGYFVDRDRRVVLFKVTYLQHKYNPLNVLEDRALSVLSQEIIHPYHGGRDTVVNVLKDTRRILKDLTDIVRGEYIGSITYQRADVITSPKTHEDRLKFLSAWLAKNQRRLATYSVDSFGAAKKLLNSYLMNREYREIFAKHPDLHREALRQTVYLTQAHQLQILEKLTQKHADRHLGPFQRLAQAVAFLEEKKEELPYYYPTLFQKSLKLWDKLMDYPYFRRLQGQSSPPAIPYRRRVWQLLILGKRLVEELSTLHHQVQEEVGRGIPLPLLTTRPPSPGKKE